MRKRNIIIANWKMHPETTEAARGVVEPIKRLAGKLSRTEIVIAPSAPHIPFVAKMILRSKKIFLGAQNCHFKNQGAYTGEVSPATLKDLGVKYIIAGHSERRAAGETDNDVNLKIRTILGNGLTPIVCIGEKERDRNGAYLEFIKNQIKETLKGLSTKDLMSLIIAYEPVWAIGKSYREGMWGTDMHEMSLVIKKNLSEMFGESYSKIAKIVYGGSVEPENAEDLLRKGEVYGFLVGHNSLDVDKFRQILKIADSIK